MVQGQNGQLVPARQDYAPYPMNYKYSKRGIGSLFSQKERTYEREAYERKHEGGTGKGVETIALSHAHRTINLGGMEHVSDAQGKLRVLDSEYWGKACAEYEQRVEYLLEISRVVSISSEVARQTMGDAFLNACPAGQTAYNGEGIPAGMQAIDRTPDLMRVLPPKSPDHSRCFAKLMWLLERTSVALDGSLGEFTGKHKEGSKLEDAVA